jgi:hypothetical protein
MPKLTLEVPHSLGRQEAARRIREQIEKLRASSGVNVADVKEQWADDTLDFGFDVMGMKVAGTLAVEDALVRLSADLPLAAMMVKKIIEQRIQQELGQLLR